MAVSTSARRAAVTPAAEHARQDDEAERGEVIELLSGEQGFLLREVHEVTGANRECSAPSEEPGRARQATRDCPRRSVRRFISESA